LPGGVRKEIVESWLAQHGKESGTVVISAGLAKQFRAEPKADPKPEIIPEEPPKQISETLEHPKTKFGWTMVLTFFAGIVIGFLLLQLFHLLF
jgi:hypothetical protein